MIDSDGVTLFAFKSNNRHTVTFLKTIKEQNIMITVLGTKYNDYCISKQRILGAKYKFRVPLRPNERSDKSMKRNKEIKIRFTNDELSSLNNYVSKAGYASREKYIRTVLLESVPKEQPNIDYQKLINEFNSIGNNLNQLVKLSYYQPLIEQETLLVLAQLKSLISSTELAVRGVS